MKNRIEIVSDFYGKYESFHPKIFHQYFLNIQRYHW